MRNNTRTELQDSVVGTTTTISNNSLHVQLETQQEQVQQQQQQQGHWIPVPQNERLEYMKKEEAVCGSPFQHCCIGQGRQLPSKHSNVSELFIKWNRPLANLSSVLSYMHHSNIPCNLWFVGFSLTGDQAVGAMCELMRDHGYKLSTEHGKCIPYANPRWNESSVPCGERANYTDGHQPAAYYELEHSSGAREECPSLTIGISGISRPAQNESYHYAQRGGVMIWNHGVHCNSQRDCIGPTINNTLAKFIKTPEAKNKWYILWRETERQHFATLTGYMRSERLPTVHGESLTRNPCSPLHSDDADDGDWRNKEARAFIDGMDEFVPILPIANATRPLWFMHCKDFERQTYDCTHYGYSPWRFHLTWDAMLQGLKQLVEIKQTQQVRESP